MITEKYLGGTDDPVKKKDLFLDMLGDAALGVPSVIVARRHRGECQRLDRRGDAVHLQILCLSFPAPTPLCIDRYVETAESPISKFNST